MQHSIYRQLLRKAAVLIAAAMIAVCTGCAGGQNTDGAAAGAAKEADPNELQTKELFAMDTYMSLTAYGEDAEAALEEAAAEIARLDEMLAAERESSEIAAINQNGGGPVSDETAELVMKAKEIGEMTDGAFEITLYPVKQLWGFKEEGNRVPADEEITKALTLVGSDKVSVDETASDQGSAEGQNAIVFAQPGMEIDLGGIAKGYTSASVIRIFEAHNVKGLVNLGGNVQACGTKPDGSDWRVAVRKPESREDDDIQWFDAATKEGKALTRADFLGIVETNDEAVITSGGYERYFEQDGKVYQHILDPKTGRPSESDTVSVTIVCKDGALADGLSTSLFVMGTEKATKLWRSGAAEFEMILLDKQGKLYVTEGLRDRFSSDLEVNWISK